MEEIDEYRERFARAHRQAYNVWGWEGLVDKLFSRAEGRASRGRLSSLRLKINRKVPWSEPKNILKSFLADKWGGMEERRGEIKTLVERYGLFSPFDENGASLEMTERVKIALLTWVFGLVEVRQEDGDKCPAHELSDSEFARSILESIGLVGVDWIDPGKVQHHIDLIAYMVGEGEVDMTPSLGLSCPCSRVDFVTGCETRTVVLLEDIIEFGEEKVQVRGVVEMEEGETVQLPEEHAERLVKQEVAAKFVYKCKSCGNYIPRNKPDEGSFDCPECGSPEIHSVHPETPREVADVLERYYRQGMQVEASLEELTATFKASPKLGEESYPRINVKQARKLASKIAPEKGKGFLDKTADQFMWGADGSKEKPDREPPERRDLRHEGSTPIEKVAREEE